MLTKGSPVFGLAKTQGTSCLWGIDASRVITPADKGIPHHPTLRPPEPDYPAGSSVNGRCPAEGAVF
jgi:hypothetical protein